VADLSALPRNAADIAAWLRKLGLQRYEEAFWENDR
jgi:SAM domain (Sterile alpha motif)